MPPQPDDSLDARLPPRALRGAESARWTALSGHARAAIAAVLGLAPAHPDVEDRAQDALVAFLASGLPRFDASRGTHEALLGVIARNLALTDLRSRSRRLRLAARLSAETPRSGTEAEHRRVEAIRDLGRILGALPATHADALLRIDLHGERIATVARQLGKSYAAVNARVGHARANARRVARELAAA